MPLRELLVLVHDGTIQIPEFQREFHLDDGWVRSLLASLSLNYSVGAIMLLESGNADVRFAASRFAGTPETTSAPGWFVVDGQQRLSALYQAFAADRSTSPGDRRQYYINILTALDPKVDRDDAILDDVPGTWLKAPIEQRFQLEWERCLFPLRLIFAPDDVQRSWWSGFTESAPVSAAPRGTLMHRFVSAVAAPMANYVVPAIILPKATARWTVRVHGGLSGPRKSDQFRAR